MATWKDGPEYAPTHRPTGFATPETSPLDDAPPVARTTPGAIPPPAQYENVAAPPLAQSGQGSAPHRSPHEPFDVSTATLTSVVTLPDGKRDPRSAFNVASSTMTAAAPTQPPPPPPGAQPIAPPTAPPPAPMAPPAAPPQGLSAPSVPANRQTYQPARQWEPSTGQWQPAKPSSPSNDPSPLVHLVTGMAFIGMLLPAAAPLMMTLGGSIAAARITKLREIGIFGAGVGGMFLLLQLVLAESALHSVFALGSFGLLVAFLVKGYFDRKR